MYRKNRKGMATIDVVLAIGLIGTLMYSFFQMERGNKIKQTHIEHIRFLQTMDIALSQSFEDIIDSYSPILSSITDADTTWGWNKDNTVSAFPTTITLGGTVYLHYNLSSRIGLNSLASLKSRLVGYFNGACRDWTNRSGGTARDLYLYCEPLVSLRYDLSDGTTNLARPFAIGTPVDGSKTPTAVITYKQYDGAGNFYQNAVYEASFGDVYNRHRAISTNRLSAIRTSLENFTNATKLREIANPQLSDGSGGLNNADDEFAGWHWKIFGDNLVNITSTFCNKPAGTTTCSNLNTNNIWRSGTNIRRGLITRRIVNNLMSGDTSYYLDGFNNGIYIYPTSMQCAGTDYKACAINALPIPADNLASTATYPNIPPFVTVIYTDPFKLKATAGKPYGRVIVGY